MAGNVTHKLSNSFEGALAGGGDPATSPLYVFGPFLRLIVVGGVVGVTFGAAVWLVVFTIAMVSAMYRLVMLWVTDGSGGSGLSEEEFGGWAVKINAAITFVEYTLTFLVSMAAMVTFIADRFPPLNNVAFLGIQWRTFLAIALSILTGWLVNRGPKTAARAFGPATAAVLGLLWAMVIFTIIKTGFHLPTINFEAFTGKYLHFTLGGFTRMLAVMTGIEVFANLVAAYDGSAEQKSSKAFGSLIIIMGTTAITMLIVGPAIRDLSEPLNEHVSVFTQTMDILLPQPLPYVGTLIGIAVLLSASAASAQGLQNLALGLRERHYIPGSMGMRNKYEVADKPVWLEVGLVAIIFLLAGTQEETYLAIYAAGVFVLLSMTGWAVVKRLVRQLREKFDTPHLLILIGTFLAAGITSAATVVIFEERFLEGAWTYFLFIPMLFVAFTYFRNRLGDPGTVEERLGELEGAMLGGFGFGQAFEGEAGTGEKEPEEAPLPAPSKPVPVKVTLGEHKLPRHILVPLDGSSFAEHSLPLAEMLTKKFHADLTLMSVMQTPGMTRSLSLDEIAQKKVSSWQVGQEGYLKGIAEKIQQKGLGVRYLLRAGRVAESINDMVSEQGVDLVVITTHGRTGVQRWLLGSVANRIVQLATRPVLIIRPVEKEPEPEPFKKLLVTLDGSEFAERVLPHVISWASALNGEVLLLRVPQVPDAEMYGAQVDEIQQMRQEAEADARAYLDGIADVFTEAGVQVRTFVRGSRPALTIIELAEEESAGVMMMATHGRGGLDRLFMGSVTERIVQHTHCPVFLVPVHERRQAT